jgi:hypothetical protein
MGMLLQAGEPTGTSEVGRRREEESGESSEVDRTRDDGELVLFWW